jgi:probable HAF family extracellular repeat protein
MKKGTRVLFVAATLLAITVLAQTAFAASVTDLGFKGLGYDINDRGMVTGLGASGGHTRAFVWTERGGVEWLPTLGGDDGYGFGINRRGEVVGRAQVSGGISHAFLWSARRGMVDLEADPSDPGLEYSRAMAINGAGNVVGSRQHVDYQWTCGGMSCARAFLWSPRTGMVDLLSLAVGSAEATDINNHDQIV